MENDFKPSVWKECTAPQYAQSLLNCDVCRQTKRLVWGEGNPEAKILILLDNPGAREDKEGNPYVCGTRQTLQLAAYTTGFKENDLFITYVLKCRPLRKYNKESARKTCMEYLDQQLKEGSFKFVFCLGDVSVQSFFSNPEITVKSTRGIWHEVRGLLTLTSYHPLAVRRRPNLYNYFIMDWEALAKRTLN